MKDIYLTNYSVKGIKTLDKTVSLSFIRRQSIRSRTHRNITLREFMV